MLVTKEPRKQASKHKNASTWEEGKQAFPGMQQGRKKRTRKQTVRYV